MNVFTVSDKLILGRETEHGVSTIQFPIAKWIEKYGSGGTFHLWNKRSQDANAYPVTITSDETYVYWTPTATDLAYNGIGEAQLDYTFGTSGTSTYRKACSEVFTTRVERSIESSSTTPAAYTAWVTQVENYATRAETAAEEAEEIVEEFSPKCLPSGGTANQVLKKKSATDYDTEWADESGGGTSDFDTLSNRPQYNNIEMTHATNIPEVKTTNWDDAYDKRHEHSNKSVLDDITSVLVSAWSTASTWVTTNGANVINHIQSTIIHVTESDKTAWNAKAETSDIPTKVSDLENDEGYIDKDVTDLTNYYKKSDANTLLDAKQNVIDSSHKLSATLISDLATVATSGSYNDLSNKPTIPSAVTEDTVSEWGFTKNEGTVTGITMNGSSKGTSGVVDLGTVITEHQSLSAYRTSEDQDVIDTAQNTAINGKADSVHTHIKSQITDFPTLADVATSGSYNDLSDKPTIPTDVITKITAQNGLTSSTTSGQATIELSSENRTEIAKIANKADSSTVTALDTRVTTAESNITTASAQIGNLEAVVPDEATSSNQLADKAYVTSGLSGKEDTSNKVTSLSSSSTDTQYPSAKCVYDIVGNVESLLSWI